MKKNLYYRTVLQRKNLIKETIFNFFLGFASFPRLVIEVFIRKNMGRRYFKRSSATLVAFFLLLLPFLVKFFLSPFTSRYGYHHQDGFWDTIKSHWMWYLFVVAFSFFSYLRYKDVKHIKDVFDMNHFSLASGDVLPYFQTLKYKGKHFTIRNIEIYIEPSHAFLAGIFFIIIGHSFLGWFLIICAICYSFSYAAAYMKGDNFILDKIDEIITNEELSHTFISDEPTKRGFRFYGEKPDSEEWRKKAYEKFYEEEDDDFSDAK